ncbi:MAG: hypothetical protein L6Q59_11320 [Ignavibacteriaceae bacterium]|nr:hypothetical protein [Ignavibacteriaceae bacterium]
MVSFSAADTLIIIISFALILWFGFRVKKSDSLRDAVLSSGELTLPLFVIVNVSTWYGGILGIGEFSYRYGIASWFTQGLPYYIFAIIYAFFLAARIRNEELISIPDKFEAAYGPKAAIFASAVIFLLTNPAPYLLMAGGILSSVTGLGYPLSMMIMLTMLIIQIRRGGFRSNISSDIILFVLMFAGFTAALIFLIYNYGGMGFLEKSLPAGHLNLTGGAPPLYILVWYLIGAWTLADPGFYQRVNAAKSTRVAKYGILISVFFWFLFDFITNSTGLYIKAILPDISDPVNAFPQLALILPEGLKALFIMAMFATVYSTLNGFLLLSGTTFGNDIGGRLIKGGEPRQLFNTGLAAASAIAFAMAALVPSVIDLWYYFGSLCIPPLLIPLLAAYYPAIKISSRLTLTEMVLTLLTGVTVLIFKLSAENMTWLEPMVAGLLVSFIFRIITAVIGIIRK